MAALRGPLFLDGLTPTKESNRSVKIGWAKGARPPIMFETEGAYSKLVGTGLIIRLCQ